ncbi:MAG TPA: beta-(1-6) glucans synthase, partial [Rhabdaerophilum sp.]|nr:beta-(1-6) glucans synthase [Rhabdaerophilum sp.]
AIGDPPIHCVSFAPFRDGQSPFDITTRIPYEQVEEDMKAIRKVTDCVRTYATDFGGQYVPPIARQLGMKIYLGIWIGDDEMRNRVQVETAIAFANRYPETIRAVIVGNEVLLRRDQSPAVLAEFIREVKSRVPVPVTYADVWEFWLKNRELADLVDFVTIHTLPYWEDIPIAADKAAAHIDETVKSVRKSFPDKEIVIGEVGWPTAGRMREGALPSLANQARLLSDVTRLARAGGYKFNWIEVIDQPWKRKSEGTVCGYWGLFETGKETPKYMPGQPVSDHPNWKVQASAGASFAAFLIALAFMVAIRRNTGGLARWLPVAAIALSGGALFGLMIEKLILESLTALDWAFSSFRAAVMIAIAIAGVIAIMADSPAPSLARLGRREAMSSRTESVAHDILLAAFLFFAIQAALAMAFDPRYRDFPTATLTIGAVPLLLMVFRQGAIDLRKGSRWLATGLAGTALFIALREGYENWQALWFVATLVGGAALLASRQPDHEAQQ